MARCCQNVGVIAYYLAGHPQVQRVNDSGLASSPSHVLAAELPTTHSPLTAEEQASRGVEPRLVRLSVGLEDVDDLVDDLGARFAATR